MQAADVKELLKFMSDAQRLFINTPYVDTVGLQDTRPLQGTTIITVPWPQGLKEDAAESQISTAHVIYIDNWGASGLSGMRAEDTALSSDAIQAVNWGCYRTAIVDGKNAYFASPRLKFEALAESWEGYNLGRSTTDYYDFAMQQIIGMGADAVPYLIERLAAGEPFWVYALKSITGQEADTPDMLGDVERIIKAWLDWGAQNDRLKRQALLDEAIPKALLQ